jgi:hypothetical protein
MTTTVRQPPPNLDDGNDQISRQLAVLRRHSRRLNREVRRIRAELNDLIQRIETHISSK